MSQLQVTGEAKIRDLQGPVVANSGVITALDGLPSQYVRGDGTLADIPSVTGGGSSVSYYLNGSVNQGTFGGSTYYQLGETAITGVGTNFSTSTDGLLAQFITDIDVPDVTEIPSGNWNIEFYMGVSASSGALASFYVDIFKYDGTTFTLIGSNSSTPDFLTNTTTVDAYFTSVAMPLTAMAETDRIAIRVYANVASKTVTLYTEDNRLCQVVTTFSRGMLSLNSLTDQQQYLTVGTAGTDFNIVSALDTHTFNIPSASATNRGLITTGSQTIAGAKTFSSTATFNTGGVFNNWGISLYDGAGSTALSSSTLTGIYASKSGSITDIVISHNAPYDSILRFSNDVANFTYTFPDLSGTIALTSDLSSYVPYSGATANVDLGSYNIFSNNVYADGDGASTNGGVLIKQYSGAFTANSGYTSLFATPNQLGLNFGGIYSAFLQSASLTASRTFTLPNLSGTIALLEGSQTFTGEKVFNNNALFNSVLSVNYGAWLQKGTPTATFSSAFTTLYSEVGAINAVFRDNTNQAKLQFQAASNYTYTFPAASGTIALTSNLSDFVTLSTYQTITANKTFSGWIQANTLFLSNSSSVSSATGFGTLTYNKSGSVSTLRITNENNATASLIFDNTTNYNYTYPATSGTLALTSNLSAYLPLTGGTLTGPLSGTSATFSDKVNINADQGAFRLYNTAAAFVGGIGNGAWVEGATLTNVALYSIGDLKFYTGGSSTNKLTIASTGAATFTQSGGSFSIDSNGQFISKQNLDVATAGGRFTGQSARGTMGTIQIDQATTGADGGTMKFNVCPAGSTTPVEIMRITSGGYLKASNNGTYNGLTAPYHEFYNTATDSPTLVTRHVGATPYGIFCAFSVDPNNTTSYLFQGYSYNSGLSLYTIWSNGTVSGRSDLRLKKNIIDSTPKLDKLMQLRVVNYEWKESIDGNKELGLIAQEVEEVFPNLVITETIKKKREIEQEDGTIIQEEYEDGDSKSIKNSVLPYITIKALQELTTLVKEQQVQIEELSNKIVALQSK